MEKWQEFERTNIFNFEKLKESEIKNLFGVIEAHNLYKENQSIFSSNAKNTSQNIERSDKKEKYLKLGKFILYYY